MAPLIWFALQILLSERRDVRLQRTGDVGSQSLSRMTAAQPVTQMSWCLIAETRL